MAKTDDQTQHLVIWGELKPGYETVLTPAAVAFIAELERKFGPERRRLLARRADIQRRLDAGWKPDFLPETKTIRDGDWRVAPIPRDIQDRRVEITGPTDRKMVINALNCGADVYMADFEDATTPSWDNLIEGQANLSDAVRRQITFDDPETGRHYALNGKTAVLFVRPRGWHLPEKHSSCRRRADVRRLVRFRAVLLPQCKGTAGARHRPLFLPAENREPSRGKIVERRVPACPGEVRSAEGHHSRDGTDRDDHGRLRDGRDPLGIARPFGRAQLRPLGLHLQLHQEIRRRPGLRLCRTGRRSR